MKRRNFLKFLAGLPAVAWLPWSERQSVSWYSYQRYAVVNKNWLVMTWPEDPSIEVDWLFNE